VPSFNTRLGLAAGPDGAVLLDAGEEHEVAPGVVHFAVLATVAEVAAAAAVGAPVVPAAVSLTLLRRATPGRLEGRGRLLRRGGRLAVAEGEVHQDGALVAKATVTFALVG
jgi:acyl-coenzyme A thioesterase PaaI-like protein